MTKDDKHRVLPGRIIYGQVDEQTCRAVQAGRLNGYSIGTPARLREPSWWQVNRRWVLFAVLLLSVPAFACGYTIWRYHASWWQALITGAVVLTLELLMAFGGGR